MKSDKFKGSFLLLLAALIWGSSFIVMKSAVDFLTPNVLLFVRFTLATLVMIIMFYKYIKDKSYENIHANCLSTYFLFIY